MQPINLKSLIGAALLLVCCQQVSATTYDLWVPYLRQAIDEAGQELVQHIEQTQCGEKDAMSCFREDGMVPAVTTDMVQELRSIGELRRFQLMDAGETNEQELAKVRDEDLDATLAHFCSKDASQAYSVMCQFLREAAQNLAA